MYINSAAYEFQGERIEYYFKNVSIETYLECIEYMYDIGFFVEYRNIHVLEGDIRGIVSFCRKKDELKGFDEIYENAGMSNIRKQLDEIVKGAKMPEDFLLVSENTPPKYEPLEVWDDEEKRIRIARYTGKMNGIFIEVNTNESFKPIGWKCIY